MLAKKNRVGTALFADMLKSSRSYHSLHFSLRTKMLKEGEVKCSAVVSKKIEKTAVGRNKLKRRMRAAIAEKYKMLPPSLTILFAKKGAGVLPFKNISEEISFLFNQHRV